MKRPNLIFFLSDNHTRRAVGATGHPVVRTPNLDRIARGGIAFTQGYTASPLCCPARAALATGRFPHETGYWDNAIVYDGRRASWMHRLRDAGYDVASVGKLHFRSTEDDNGFSEEIQPMHILNGKGGVSMLLRWSDEEQVNGGQWELYLEKSKVGETTYQQYDRDISRRAIDWLSGRAARSGRPWALLVSYVSPHPPFTVPERFKAMYPDAQMPLPPRFRSSERPEHPSLAHLRRIMAWGAMDDEAVLRRIAACYYALITHLDEQVGTVLDAAAGQALLDNTHLVYTSDHGEAIGAHGLFGKANLYEPAAGVPLLWSGPGVPAGRVVDTPVSHVDLFPTIVELAGLPVHPDDADLYGDSLAGAGNPGYRHRAVFAEYHATGTRRGVSMLRDGRHKLLYHLDAPHQLFDLADDPDEAHDLVAEGRAGDRAAAMARALESICDPRAVDEAARADQKAKALFWGGNEAIRKEGSIVFTPAPGTKAEIGELKPLSA